MPNRRERRSRPVSIAPVIALAILAVGIAFAQQNLPVPTPPPPQAAPVAGDTPAPVSDDAAGTDTSGAANAGTPAKPVTAKGSPQRFEPTERVRPDFDVAFPVDI
jgi:hypothetical protein